MSGGMSGAAPGKKTTDMHGVVALLRTLLAEGQDEQAIELVVGLLSRLVEKNTELELRLRKAMRQRFGRTSEKLSAEQLSLFLTQLGQEDAGPRKRRSLVPGRLASQQALRRRPSHRARKPPGRSARGTGVARCPPPCRASSASTSRRPRRCGARRVGETRRAVARRRARHWSGCPATSR
ncbi:transposase [Archangium lipolyticum]|uniref:transposase n=1 Tax=Archangium lipolyticum TaxID=2970465 RepID=UPI0027D44F8F|nr:transposase [Archangium lipolyticum]